MSDVAEAMRMANDPPKYFDYDARKAHKLPRDWIDDVQRTVMRERFAALRDRVAVLKATADEQGVKQIDNVDEGANLLFPHTVYKSYPVSLLIKNRYDHMTKWLGRLTAADVSKVDYGPCNGIDSWLQALEDREIIVTTSSGTGGAMTFLPRTPHHSKIVSDIFGMTSRDFNGFHERPNQQNEPWHCFFLAFRGGRSHLGRSAGWLIDNFAKSRDYFYPLYDIDMSSDVMFMAARVRLAESRGELDRLEVSPQLKARQAEFEAIQKKTAESMDRLFEKLLEVAGQKEKVYLGGMSGAVTELATRALGKGYKNAFGPDRCIVQCGGGGKGSKLPDDWEQRIMNFTGVNRMGQYYGMTEVTMITSKCELGHYHISPWVVMYLMDPDTGRLLPKEGVQTGRAAFFDLVPQTYWGGFVSGDLLTVDWRPCPCGRTTVHIHPEVKRVSETKGGDDKITCAASDDAHAAAIDFLANLES
jgi:hypothetical protein